MVTEPVNRDQIRKFVTEQENRGNKRHVKLVEIWIDNPKLKGGLVLIDTPGIGSLNIDHTAITYGIVPYADAVLFTGAAGDPLLDPELDFAARIGKHTRRLMYVLTKRDRVENWEERLRDDVAKLEARMGFEAATIPGVAVSSEIKLEYLRDQNEDTLNNSGFPEFERKIWELLGQSASILLGRAQGRVLPVISQLRLPLEAEKTGLEAQSAKEIKDAEDSLQAKISRADELGAESAFWVADLNTYVAKLQADCAKGLADQFAALHQAVNDYLKIPDYVRNPEKLGAMLTVDCNNSFGVTLANVETRVGQIVVALRDATALQLDEGHASVSASSRIEIAGAFDRRNESFFKKASDIGRSSTIHTMGLGTMGGFAGAVIGGIIGTFVGPAGTVGGALLGLQYGGAVGAFLGGIFGVKRGFSELAERDMAWLRQNLAAEARRQIDIAQRTLSYELTNLLTTVRNDIHQDLLRQIQNEQKACRSAAAALARGKQERLADFSQKLRSLSNDLRMLDRLEAAARTFTETADGENAAAA
jgi:hypothetical protein